MLQHHYYVEWAFHRVRYHNSRLTWQSHGYLLILPFHYIQEYVDLDLYLSPTPQSTEVPIVVILAVSFSMTYSLLPLLLRDLLAEECTLIIIVSWG
jgi:hypothetical protein